MNAAPEQAASDLPEFFDAQHACQLLKRQLLHRLGPAAEWPLQDSAPMPEVLAACCRDSPLPWLLATAISLCRVRCCVCTVLGRSELC